MGQVRAQNQAPIQWGPKSPILNSILFLRSRNRKPSPFFPLGSIRNNESQLPNTPQIRVSSSLFRKGLRSPAPSPGDPRSLRFQGPRSPAPAAAQRPGVPLRSRPPRTCRRRMGTPEPLRWLSCRPATLSAAPAIAPAAGWGRSRRRAPAEAECPLADLGGAGRGGARAGPALKGPRALEAQDGLEERTETEQTVKPRETANRETLKRFKRRGRDAGRSTDRERNKKPTRGPGTLIAGLLVISNGFYQEKDPESHSETREISRRETWKDFQRFMERYRVEMRCPSKKCSQKDTLGNSR